MRAVLRFLFLTLVLVLGVSLASTASASWDVYVVAHQDDWQTFMMPGVDWDYHTYGNNILIIITTAGDAGRTDGWWEARELATMASVRELVGADQYEGSGTLTFNGHSILLRQYGHPHAVVVAFMRLPNPSLGSGPITADCPQLEPKSLPTSARGSSDGRLFSDSC